MIFNNSNVNSNNLRFKLEERLEALRSNNFKGLPKSVELDTAGIHLSDSSKARGSCPPSKTKSLELPWIVSESKPGSFGTRSSIARHSKTNLKAKSLVPSIPHEIKKEKFQENTWTWLSWSIKNNNLITGRIARSLQRAGICVLIGGFTAFLPYKEYSVRNKIICAKEAELQSFQILNLKWSNLNCVLSKDRVTHKYDRSWNVTRSELTK